MAWRLKRILRRLARRLLPGLAGPSPKPQRDRSKPRAWQRLPTDGALRARWTRSLGKNAGGEGVDEVLDDIRVLATPRKVLSSLTAVGDLDMAALMLAKTGVADWSARLAAPVSPGGAFAALENALAGSPAGIAGEDTVALAAEVERAHPDLPAVWWIVTHTRLFRLAAGEAALAARNAAARRSLAGRPGVKLKAGGADMMLAAAIQLGDAATINAVLEEGESVYGAAQLQRARFSALISTGEAAAALAVSAASYSRDHDKLADRLAGREVALVGPARNSLGSGPAIDGFDLVVRTNYIDAEGFRTNGTMLGTRTDMSYYNSNMMKNRPADITATLVRHPDVVAAFRADWCARDAHRASPLTPIHRYDLFGHVFFGRGYAMRHAIADLLRFPVAGITVFGADFFLSPETHYNDYVPVVANQVRSYIRHDVFDCWRFMRTLKHAGVIKADKILSDILDLDEAAFAAAIADRVRHHGGKRTRPAA